MSEKNMMGLCMNNAHENFNDILLSRQLSSSVKIKSLIGAFNVLSLIK
jgi:hypothetical protein